LNGQRYAFEPFASLDGVLRGEPIRIMPLGQFYRGDRKLEITEERLKAIAANLAAGLPRFRVPINENHSGVGKVGTVHAVEFKADGADGPGLYATDYELTDDGRKLVKAKRFDATSPEIIWSLNEDAKYQDPQTGEYHDNVLVGLALTEKPFFGHDNVALFSADRKMGEQFVDNSDAHLSAMRKAMKKARDLAYQFMAAIDGWGEELPEHKRPQTEKAMDKQRPDEFYGDYPSMPHGYPAHRLLDAIEIISDMGKEMEGVAGVGDALESAKNELKQVISKLVAMYSGDDVIAERFREFDAEKRRELAAKGQALLDGSFPIVTAGDLRNAVQAWGRASNQALAKKHIIKRAKALGATDLLPDDWKESMSEEKETEDMGDKTTPTPQPEAVKSEDLTALKAKAEQFEAQLKAQTEQFEAKLKAADEKADKFATELTHEKRARRLEQMKDRAEQFVALPAKADELAQKLLELEEANADLFTYFIGRLEAADKALVESDLFSQKASARADTPAASFEALVEQIHREKFNSEPGKYADAFMVAGEQRPDLAQAYKQGARR